MTDTFTSSLNEYLEKCDAKDVIAFGSKGLFQLDVLQNLIIYAFDKSLITYISNYINPKLERKCNTELWFKDGEDCEILKAGSAGWQKGKMKLKINVILEFIPDEPQPESPLDDIREEINQNNS
ncbi:MAG: KGK domain-containing protein [Xenococcus sp. MO_188.B8]|nr:KGK domain-containing protein [Xenococcus sp. MO_188.B8]